MQNINEIDELIKIISKLPGLGPKSARRIILKLINNRSEIMRPMLNTLTAYLGTQQASWTSRGFITTTKQ